MSYKINLAAMLLLAAGSLSATAQELSPEGANVEVGEAIDVRVVNVEAVVTDSRGQRIEGLKPEDFRLLVDGKEVPIDYFTEIRGGAAVEVHGDVSASPVSGAVGRNLLIFIDQRSTIQAQLDLVLRRLDEDLDRLGSADQIALAAVDAGGRLQILADWTSDAARLRAALAGIRRQPTGGVVILGEDVAGTAAMAVMRAFSSAPGRKVMLLLSGGWSEGKEPRLIEAANLLGYSLYPVDVAGLQAAVVPMDASQAGLTAAEANTEYGGGFITSIEERRLHYGFEVLARETGGKASLNGLREAALERTLEDTEAYYWIGFSPTWKADGKKHDIRLKARPSGMRVRARRSYSDLSLRAQQALEAQSRRVVAAVQP